MDMSQHPQASSASGTATPNLPALITALPGDHTRAPQTEFTRERQVVFLENLSVTGSVRSAACAARAAVSSTHLHSIALEHQHALGAEGDPAAACVR